MKLSRTIKNMLSSLLDVVLPPASESIIARSLNEETLIELVTPALHIRLPWVYCLFRYSHPKVRALLRAIKYRGEQTPLSALGKITADEIASILEDKILLEGWKNIVMAPIPGSPKRRRERGYNQADRIARAALPYLGDMLTYSPDILARRDRPSQVDVPKEARRRNVAGAFFVPRPEKVSGRQVLLIDDVVESGATLEDSRRALMEAGALDVIAVAIAH